MKRAWLSATVLTLISPATLATPTHAAPLFAAAQELFVPGVTTIADVNGDGKPDLIIANNAASGAVDILLGNGDGTFGPAAQFPTAPSPAVAAVGDINGDGKADIVTANADSQSVSILFGNGDGTFEPPQNISTGSGATSVAIVDMNGDPYPDLVVTNPTSNTISILRGIGGGGFAPRVNIPDPFGPAQVVTGDFNEDGFQDAIVSESAGSIAVMPGSGNGTLALALRYPLSGEPVALVAEDFNLDGHLDLAAVSAFEGVQILVGSGDGNFRAGSVVQFGQTNFSLAVADMDQDGIPDLIGTGTNDFASYSWVEVYTGLGDGAFVLRAKYDTGDAAGPVVTGDLDGDGKSDVVVGNGSLSWSSRPQWTDDQAVFLGIGDGRLVGKADYDIGGNPYAIVAADFNRDGSPDLITNDRYHDFRMWIGSPAGVFVRSFITNGSQGLNPSQPATADMNGDSIPDIVTQLEDSLMVRLGAGNGTFTPPVSHAMSTNASAIAMADFNGDGFPDVATANGGPSTVSVFLGHGDGTVGDELQLHPGSNCSAIAVADLNGDHHPDIVVTTQSDNSISVLLGNGDGTFQPPLSFGTGLGPDGVAIGDFNEDGIPDLVTANYSSGNVSELLGRGDGTFLSAMNSPAETGSYAVAVGDMNRDAHLDVVSSNGLAIVVAPGKGDGTFGPALQFEVGEHCRAIAVADFNSDGKLDVATVDEDGQRFGTMSVFLNDMDRQVVAAKSNITVSSTSLDLGQVPVGSWSAAKMIISNSGPGLGHITSIDAAGPPFFASTFGFAIPARRSVSLVIRFMPTTAGDFGASLTLQTDDPAQPAITVQLRGQGGIPTATDVSLVSATADPGVARLTWYTAAHGISATVYRRTAATGWSAIGTASPDGSGFIKFEDHTLAAGGNFGYRLGITEGGAESFAGETWVQVPASAVLALDGMRPNPAVRELSVSFSLPDDSPTSLELMDLAGRRVRSIDVGAQGPGHHVLSLGNAGSLPAGIYLIRLHHAQRTLVAKAVVMR